MIRPYRRIMKTPAALAASFSALPSPAAAARPMTHPGSARRGARGAIRNCRPTDGWSPSCGRPPTSPPGSATPTSGSFRPTAPAAPKLLVGGDKTENTPRWAPDGSHIAFISTATAITQIYIADADGSNVRQFTKVAGGVQPPMVISPDRSMIAFVADVKVGEDTPSNVHLLTRLLYRHWDEWRENVRHHVFVASLAGGDPRDLTPGDFDSPPTQQEDAAIAFTPDSKEIVFVSNREGIDKEAFTTNNDVWSVPVGGGTAKKLTPNPGGRRAAACSRATASS